VSVPAGDAAGVLATIGGRGLVVVVRDDVDGGATAGGSGATAEGGAPAAGPAPAAGVTPAGPTG
jgi:hypothetical protein